ncbi:MAG: metallopeptidase TldD-related protein [Candidatus Cloacimonadaceae bacterium]
MKAQLEAIADFVKKHVKADDYTLRIQAWNSHETRFAQNAITQHIAGENINIDLEAAFGQKTGRSSVNQADENSLLEMIRRAEEMASVNESDPEYVESASQQEIPKVQNASQSTLELKPEQMVELIKKSIANAEKQNAIVSGMTEKHYMEMLTTTKNGFNGYYDITNFGHSMTLKKDETETKVSYSSKDYGAFNLEQDIEKLNAQSAALHDLQPFQPCRIPLIIRPGALIEFYMYMLWMMNRRQTDEGLTPFTGQLGKKCMGEKFSMLSTLTMPDLVTEPFSNEAVVAKETYWVRNGVLENLPTPRYWAKLKNLEPSDPFNIYIPGENVSEEKMMQMVPEGLIVNRFWYIRPVDMKTGEVTGMTRDGVLYFKEGKVRHAVNNLRFNEIPADTTKRILALGVSELADSAVKLPTVLVDGFNFVDSTTF